MMTLVTKYSPIHFDLQQMQITRAWTIIASTFYNKLIKNIHTYTQFIHTHHKYAFIPQYKIFSLRTSLSHTHFSPSYCTPYRQHTNNALYNEHTKWLTLVPTQPLVRNKLNGQLIPWSHIKKWWQNSTWAITDLSNGPNDKIWLSLINAISYSSQIFTSWAFIYIYQKQMDTRKSSLTLNLLNDYL